MGDTTLGKRVTYGILHWDIETFYGNYSYVRPDRPQCPEASTAVNALV